LIHTKMFGVASPMATLLMKKILTTQGRYVDGAVRTEHRLHQLFVALFTQRSHSLRLLRFT